MHVQPAYAHFLGEKYTFSALKIKCPPNQNVLTYQRSPCDLWNLVMTFKGHVHLKTLNLASCMSIGRFLWSRNPSTAQKLPYPCSKVILVTFRTFSMTFKGQIYLKIPNLASCMSICMFFGSRNPNLA